MVIVKVTEGLSRKKPGVQRNEADPAFRLVRNGMVITNAHRWYRWISRMPALLLIGCGGGNSSSDGQQGPYTAALTWTQPSLNTDGSALADAAGYRIDYGSSPASLTMSVPVAGAANTSASVTGLSAGTYYFTVSTLNAAGAASARSEVVSKAVP
jgi:fibronectin type III domain protein